MTTTSLPTNRPANRPAGGSVTGHLVRTQLEGLWVLFVGFLVAVAVVGALIHLFAEVTGSVWRGATQWLHWYAAAMGVYLSAVYLPLYLAHGRTRREFATGAGMFSAVLAVWLAVATAIGFAAEWGAYHLLGWSGRLPDPHPLASVGAAFGTVSQAAAVYLAFIVTGALAGAAFYRRISLGLLLVVPCLVLLALSAVYTVGDDFFFDLPALLDDPGLTLRLVVSLLTTAVAMAGTWLIVRDIPLRQRAN